MAKSPMMKPRNERMKLTPKLCLLIKRKINFKNVVAKRSGNKTHNNTHAHINMSLTLYEIYIATFHAVRYE